MNDVNLCIAILEAEAIRSVVNRSIEEGIVTKDLSEGSRSCSTTEVGDWLAANL